ncbi:MAG: hypothetical protein JWN20_1522 [Jatrophihabitantaceae bacterium]|nr:hypothetical protein [Jatrophihabitantaceae bacterium]
MDDVHAPFPADVVHALNAFHAEGADGGLSCPAPVHDEDLNHPATMLFATKSALVCPDPQCGYRQLWIPAYAVAPRAEPDSEVDDRVAEDAGTS